jgi:hypothetical protein
MILANFFSDWWNALTLSKQIFYGIAIFAAMLVIVMAVVSMFGIGDDAEVDADAADSGGTLFSIKPIIGFLFAFGWAGGASLSGGLAVWLACIIALAAGFAVMFAIVWILRATQRLKVDGTLKKEDAIGKVATVYVTIPPGMQSGGQIIVPLDGRTITLGALQKGSAPIPADTKVKVAALIDSNTALIEPI